MKSVLCLFLGIVLATPSVADSIAYMRVPRPLIEEHLKPSPDTEAQRVTILRNQFQKAGCPQLIEQPIPEEQSPNLICILPGFEEGTILVGASLDYAAEDAKNPAHWSALTLLPLLAKSLAVPHRSTLVLVAFPGREHGMRGASHYVSQLSEIQRRTLRAVVDLDNLGRTPTAYALGQTDKTLATWLQAAAHSLKLAPPPMLDVGKSDASGNGVPALKDEDLWANAKPFEQQHVPAITLRSAPPLLLAALRKDGSIPERFTGNDFDLDAFDDTYRLLCVYVLYLDGNLGRPPIRLGMYKGTLLDTAGNFGTRTIDTSIKIDRYTTMAELSRFEAILKKGGQEALADAFEDAADRGSYRVGYQLATSLKVAIAQNGFGKNSEKTPTVLLVGVRIKRTGERNTVDDYRFDLIQLKPDGFGPDGKGVGEGLFYPSVRLRFNPNHELEIEDRRYNLPDEVRQLKWEAPVAAKAAGN